MRKQKPTVEWHVAKDEEEWERICAAPVPSSALPVQPSLHLRYYLWAMTGLFVFLAIARGWWWHTPQSDPPPQATAKENPEAATANSTPVVMSITDDPVHSAWQDDMRRQDGGLQAAILIADSEPQPMVTLETLEIQDDRAVARVILRDTSGAPTYRQMRFYRHVATGWVQTVPDAALWGPERSLETPHFDFHFRQNDEPVIIAVAAQIDTLYTDLRRNFGLPTVTTPQQRIDVQVTETPGQALRWVTESKQIAVPSPAVYLAPIELTDADLLAQSLALPLLDSIIAEAGKHYAPRLMWQPMLQGLRLWQVWDLNLPLADWQPDVVQWLYRDLPLGDPKQLAPLPKRYPALCVTHQLWMPSPLQIDIPFVCTEEERGNAYLAPGSFREPPTQLDDLHVLVPLDDGSPQQFGRVVRPGQTVALATLIEYAVATYGHERLPALMTGMAQYQTWKTLIPAVYGVSSAEFEVGWQAYLMTHYKK